MNIPVKNNTMNQPTQLHLIYKLEAMRQVILKTAELSTVLQMAQKVYDIALPVPIDPEFIYKIEGKERTLRMLQNEIRQYMKSNIEVEVIQFQLSSTILMLMLQFIEGSLEGMETVPLKQDTSKIA